MAHHYTLGAGMVGCLYDYGPYFFTRRMDAIETAIFYLTGAQGETDAEWDALKREQTAMCTNLRTQGIHYFSADVRPMVGAHYIELSKSPGRCPRDNDE